MLRLLLAIAAVTGGLLLANGSPADARPDSGGRELIAQVNEYRAANGRARVRSHPGLERAARSHCRDMRRARFFGHESSDGRGFAQRIKRFVTKRFTGENLATYPARMGGEEVIADLWMTSDAHRTVMLDRSFRRIGVARCWGRFGGSRKESAIVTNFASAR